jgi:ABC-type iron transport system FetAB ATPase subunit
MAVPKRILVLGPSGAGKSTLAEFENNLPHSLDLGTT